MLYNMIFPAIWYKMYEIAICKVKSKKIKCFSLGVSKYWNIFAANN